MQPYGSGLANWSSCHLILFRDGEIEVQHHLEHVRLSITFGINCSLKHEQQQQIFELRSKD